MPQYGSEQYGLYSGYIKPGIAYAKPKVKRGISRLGEYVRGEIPGTVLPKLVRAGIGYMKPEEVLGAVKFTKTLPGELVESIRNIPPEMIEYMQSVGQYGASPDIQYTPQMAWKGLEYGSEAITGGVPGGLPAGAVGVGITRKQALADLTRQSMERVASKGPKNFPFHIKKAAKTMRNVVSGLAQTPEKTLAPVRKIRFHEEMSGRYYGMADAEKRAIYLNRFLKEGTIPHEATHISQWFPEEVFEKLSPGRKVIAQEAQDIRGDLLVRARRGEITREEFLDLDPVEIHADHMSGLFKGREIPGDEEYDRIFWENFDRSVKFSRRAAKQLLEKRTKIKPTYYPWEEIHGP
jgi:hypothetical protein